MMFVNLILKALEQHAGGEIDNEKDRKVIAESLAREMSPILGLLHQARSYIDGSKDPEVEVEGVIASSIDGALKGLIGESYKPPGVVLGRKHLRDVSPKNIPDFDLDALPDELREILAAAQLPQEGAEDAYGFVWRGREVLWSVPLEIVPLRRVPAPYPGVDFLVGKTAKSLPLFAISSNGEQAMNVRFDHQLAKAAEEAIEKNIEKRNGIAAS